MLKNTSSGGNFYSEMAAESRTIDINGTQVTTIDGGTTTPDSGYAGDPYLLMGIDANRDGVIDGGAYKIDPTGFHILSNLYISGSVQTEGNYTVINDSVWILKNGATESDLNSVFGEVSARGGGLVILPPSGIIITSSVSVPDYCTLMGGKISIEMATSTVIDLGYSSALYNCFIEDTTNATSSINAVRMQYAYAKVIGCSFYSKQYGKDPNTNVGYLRFVSVEAKYCVVANNVMVDWAGDYVYSSIVVQTGGIRCSINGNAITNGKYGIVVYGTNNSITGNSIFSIISAGIYLGQYAEYTEVTGNQVDCGYISIYLSNTSNVVVVGNSCNTSIYKGSGAGVKIAHNLGSSYHDM